MSIYVGTFFLAIVASLLPRMERGPRALRGSEVPTSSSAGILAGWSVFGVLAFVAAFRWRVGADYAAYESTFTEYAGADLGELFPFGEPGIRFLAQTGDAFGLDTIFMFGAAAVLTIGLSLWTIARASPSFTFGVFLFITLGAWTGSFNAVRQYVAAAIVFAGYQLILRRKLLPYLGVVAVAALFHVSALILVLLYWIPRKRMGLGAMCVLVLLTIVASSSYELLFDAFGALTDKSSGVVTDYATEEVSPLRIVFWSIPIFIMVFISRIELFSSSDFFFVNVLIINLAVWVMSAGSAYIARLAIYTALFATVAIPRLFNSNAPQLNIIAKIGMVVAAISFWLFGIYSSPHLQPFQWIWDSMLWRYLVS